MILLNRSL